MGWTQSGLASRLGYSQNTIAGWETGKRSCRIETIEQLSHITGYPLHYFLGDSSMTKEPTQAYRTPEQNNRNVRRWDNLAQGFELQLQRLERSVYALESALKKLEERT